VQALVLTPTRELALQVYNNARAYCRHSGITPAVVYGGQPKDEQEGQFAMPVQILIATPGRLIDFLYQDSFDLQKLKFFVLDEADRMLDMGFIPDIELIVMQMPKDRQTLLFSATFPNEIKRLSAAILNNPIQVAVGIKRATAEGITQVLFEVSERDKEDFLVDNLRKIKKDIQRAVIFTRTKKRCDDLARHLRRVGIKAEGMHSDRSQEAREATLKKFRDGKLAILVATDIASRGLDIDNISHVVNFDVPLSPEDYVHRVGRTARMDATGLAWTLCDRRESRQLTAIERLLGRRIPRPGEEGSEAPPETSEPKSGSDKPKKEQAKREPRKKAEPDEPKKDVRKKPTRKRDEEASDAPSGKKESPPRKKRSREPEEEAPRRMTKLESRYDTDGGEPVILSRVDGYDDEPLEDRGNHRPRKKSSRPKKTEGYDGPDRRSGDDRRKQPHGRRESDQKSRRPRRGRRKAEAKDN
jgi:ATP-dependent RNA helicase RhlE